MANVQSVIALMAEIAPQRLAYDWDNVGLQAGEFNQNVEKVLVTLDITDSVIEEAIKINADMVISHHPLIFKGLKSIHSQTGTGKTVIKAIKNNIALYSAHTNLDIADGGLNDHLAEILGMNDIKPLDTTWTESCFKLAVYVPDDYLDQVEKAVLNNGGGHIGNYSHTSFSTQGTGTFKPLPGSNPYQGKKGEIAKVNEVKFETIVPQSKCKQVIASMLKAHPYEEVAYDLYQINKVGDKYGLGRVGRLTEKMKLEDYLIQVKDRLNLKTIKYIGSRNNSIEKVAICSGSGGDLIDKANRAGADLYITGDVKYHQAQLAEELGLNLIDAGHYETETIVKDLLVKSLNDRSSSAHLEVKFVKSEKNTNPWNIMV